MYDRWNLQTYQDPDGMYWISHDQLPLVLDSIFKSNAIVYKTTFKDQVRYHVSLEVADEWAKYISKMEDGFVDVVYKIDESIFLSVEECEGYRRNYTLIYEFTIIERIVLL